MHVSKLIDFFITKSCKDVLTTYNYNPHTLHHLKPTGLKIIVIIRVNITIENHFEAIVEKQFLGNVVPYLLFHDSTSLYELNNSSLQKRKIVYRFVPLILQNIHKKSLSQLKIILHMHYTTLSFKLMFNVCANNEHGLEYSPWIYGRMMLHLSMSALNRKPNSQT